MNSNLKYLETEIDACVHIDREVAFRPVAAVAAMVVAAASDLSHATL